MRNKHIDNFPRKPVISRFVAPWDTSGWYGVWPDLQPGSRLYTNSEAQVAQLPEKYRGVPYIRTYNSNAEGFDDKQEVDFYVEQDAVVYRADRTSQQSRRNAKHLPGIRVYRHYGGSPQSALYRQAEGQPHNKGTYP